MGEELWEIGNVTGLPDYVRKTVCSKCQYKEKQVCSGEYTDEDFDAGIKTWCEAYDQLCILHEKILNFRNLYIDKIEDMENLLDIEPLKEHTELASAQEDTETEDNETQES